MIRISRRTWTILASGTILAATPAQAQTYDPNYPVCMQLYGDKGNYIDCRYTSLTHCSASASGRAAQCFTKPIFRAFDKEASRRDGPPLVAVLMFKLYSITTNQTPIAALLSGATATSASEGRRIKISIFLRRYGRIAGKLVPRGDDHTLAGTNDDMMARAGMMHRCGTDRRTEADQQAQGKDRAHPTCSKRPYLWFYHIGRR